MGFELLGLGLAVSKTIGNGNGIYIFIWYTGISNNWDWDFEKNSAGKWDRDPPSGPSIDLENTLNMLQISVQANRNFQGHNWPACDYINYNIYCTETAKPNELLTHLSFNWNALW